MKSIQGPFTKPPTVIRWLYLTAFVAFFTMAFFLAISAADPAYAPEAPISASLETQNERETYAPDPCGLASVECPNETPVAAQAWRRIDNVTLYTYQAEPSQTDETPCSGAMADIDFCNPTFPIVANNCLPLGTQVTFDFTFTIFTVADRMNARYGCDVFDILTDGVNYRHLGETAYADDNLR